MADDRDPDLTDDPRGQGMSEGYPERQPEGEDASRDQPYPDDAERGGTTVEGPSPSSADDEDPRRATGNPGAAG